MKKRHIKAKKQVFFMPQKPLIFKTVLVFVIGLTLLLGVVKWVNRDVQAIWAPTLTAWNFRQQLNIVNSSSVTLHGNTTIAVTIDTKNLVNLGKLKADCSDLRVAYQPNNTTSTELSRYLVYPGGGTCASSATTRVYIPLQADMASSATNANYYVYFGNKQAAAPSNSDNAFDIGAKDALLVCPFDGSTTCAAGETPSTATGALRYSGGKSALSFDGVNDYVGAGNVNNLTGVLTIEGWFYATNIPTDTALVAKAANGYGYMLYFPGSRGISFYTADTAGWSSTDFLQTANNVFNLNTWNHVAGVWDGTKRHIFLNGQEIATADGNAPAAYGEGLTIGTYASDVGENFPGYIDEVRISNVVRYTSNFTPQTTPFVRDQYTKLLYHFDENGDDPRNTGKALDDSGNGNHGTIAGAKYVDGLVGINSISGNVSSQSYSAHNGLLVEEGTVNKILNPSFENATYDTNWYSGINLTVSENTDAAYNRFGSKSLKLISTSSGSSGASILEQHIELTSQSYFTESATAVPTDNSLGIMHWDGSKYPNSTVYFEAVMTETGSGLAQAALYDTDGTLVTNSVIGGTSGGTYTRYRSGAITLNSGTEYTVRIYNTSAGSNTYFKAARLIIVQNSASYLGATQTNIELGYPEGTGNTTFSPLRNNKTYTYNSASFSPQPKAYVEATVDVAEPKIEQQINIVDQFYQAYGTAVTPEENSLGSFRWDADKYSGTVTVYFETVMAESGGGSSRAQLYKTDGTPVDNSAIGGQSSGNYYRYRSAALTLTDDTDYTVKVFNTASNGWTYLRSAKLVIVQSDSTKLTKTETHAELGAAEGTSSNSYAEQNWQKIYYYDESKYSPTPTNYFEASFQPSEPKIEQQLNITNQSYASVGTSLAPADDSLGFVRWDADKFSGTVNVYFEVVMAESGSGSSVAKLYDSAGNYVDGSQLGGDSSGAYVRYRSAALSLTDDRSYTVKVYHTGASGTVTLRAARLIVTQSNATRITATETQPEVGNNETSTQTSYTPLTDRKIYNYDVDQFSPTPVAYFEATIANDTAGQTTSVALYENGETCAMEVSGSEVTVTGTTWALARSSAISLTDGRSYMVCLKTSANTAKIASAKIILDQSASGGISSLETIQLASNTLATTTASGYTSTTTTAVFDPEQFGTAVNIYSEATLKQTTAGKTAYADFVVDGAAVVGTEVSTTNQTYTSVRSNNFYLYGLKTVKALTGYIKTTSGGTVSASEIKLVVQIPNLPTNGPTGGVELYNKTDSAVVSGSELTTTTAGWQRLRSSALTLTTGKEYVVKLKNATLANAKIILDQSESSGITNLEIPITINNTYVSLKDNSYTSNYFYNYFDPDNYGVAPVVLHEAVMKNDVSTSYAKLMESTLSTQIDNSETYTAETNWKRTRSPDAYLDLNFVPRSYTTLIKSAVASGTNQVASSTMLVQINNLPTSGAAGSIELYNVTDDAVVSGSVTSTTTTGFRRIRSSTLTLVDGKTYELRIKQARITEARLILNQNSAVAKTEVLHYSSVIPTSRAGSVTRQYALSYFDPANFSASSIEYYFQARSKVSAGTGAIELYNVTGAATITGSNSSTTSTSYTNHTSGNIYSNMPATAAALDMRLTGTSGTMYNIASWLTAKLVFPTGGVLGQYYTEITPGNTNTHTLSAYVYNGTSGAVGGTVDATVAKLVFNGSSVIPAYTDLGGGWWRLAYSAATTATENNYGIETQGGKTIYVDGVQLEEKAYATTYADGSLGTGYAWTDSASSNNSTSTRTTTQVKYTGSDVLNTTRGTISLWVRPNWNSSQSSHMYLFDSTPNRFLLYRNPSNDIELYINNTLAGTFTAPTALTRDKWSHVVVTYDTDTDVYKVYINNSLVSTSNVSISPGSTLTAFHLGMRMTDDEYGNGLYSDLRTYGSALTADEVTDLYYAGLVSRQDTYATVTVENFQDNPGTGGAITNKVTNPSFENSTFNTNWIQTQSYTLEDEFNTDRAEGAVNGSAAEAGPGNRIASATGISIANGKATVISGGEVRYNSVQRSAGLTLFGKVTSTTRSILFGFDDATSGQTFMEASRIDPTDAAVYTNKNIGSSVSGTEYKQAIVLRSTGAYHLIKGAVYTNWSLLDITNTNSTATLYPGASGYSGSTNVTLDSLRIPTQSWLPTPLAYDTFGTDGATQTETSGPDGQTTPQLAWTNGTKSGGKMSISPILGSEILTNGNMETADPPSGWTALSSATLDGVNDERTGGSGGQSLSVVNGSSASATARKTFTNNNGDWVTLTGYSRMVTSAAQLVLRKSDGGAIATAQNNSTSWTSQRIDSRMTTANGILDLRNAATTLGAEGRYDDISLKVFNLSSLFATVSTADKDVVMSADTIIDTGTSAGIATNLNSSTSPTAGVVAYYERATNKIKLDKFISLTSWTNLINQSATYVSGATIRIVTYHSDANTLKVRVYYNDALMGTEQTITDGAIISNTIHGLFSTNSENTFDNFSLFARGSDGEYNSMPVDPTEQLTATASTAKTKTGTNSVLLTNTNASYPFQYVTSLNAGNTNTHTFSAYVYNNTSGAAGGKVDTSVAKLVYNGTVVTPSSYVDAGQGWWRLVYTAAGVNAAGTYGVEVQAGKTVYLDGVQLEEGSNATDYTDGSMGEGFSWTGTANDSTSSRTGGQGKGQEPTSVWRFDEGYGTTTNDSTLNFNHLTISGATWTKNLGSSYLSFDGTNDYLSRVSDSDFDFGSNPFTVGGTFKHLSTISGTDTILARQSGSTGYKIYMNASGYICFSVNSNSACTTTSYADSKWHVFSAVRGANDLKLYVDGLQKAVTNVSSPATVDGANSLYLGIDSDGTSNPWAGFLDDIAIYPYARTATEVKGDILGTQTAVRLASYGNDNLTNGLVGWWKMDETSGTLTDSSGNGRTGTWHGTGADHYTTGKYSNGGGFNGTNDYISTNISSLNEFTVSAWVKYSSSGLQNIMSGSGATWYMSINYSGSRIAWHDGRSWRNGTTNIGDNNWHLVTYIFNKGAHYMAVDGKIEYNNNYGNGAFTSGSFSSIGTIANLNERFFNGKMDDVRIYNRAFSVSELEQLYKYAPGPIAHYKFDEGSGTGAYDSSGNGNTGTISGNPSWVAGIMGKALNFDGDGDYVISNANIPITGTQPRTMSAWIKPNSTTGERSVMSIGSLGTCGRFNVTQNASYVSHLNAWCDSNNVYTLPSPVKDGWKYLSVIYDGTNIILYVNGQLVATTPKALNTLLGKLTVGSTVEDNPYNRFFNGVIDDVRIYNYARSQEQILADMQVGADSVPKLAASSELMSAPVAYYKFDEGYGTTANNSGNSGSALNGTLTNMASPATATSGWTQNGKFGKALVFDSTDDVISAGSSNTFNLTSELTISAWIKPSDWGENANGRIVDRGSTNGYMFFVQGASNNRLSLYAGNQIYSAVNSITLNTWQHVLVTVKSNVGTIYVNGQRSGSSGSISLPNLLSTTTYIGNSEAGDRAFSGSIDEVKIYNFALSPDQVKQEYNKGASMKLGSTGTDSSGNASNSSNDAYCPPGQGTACVAPVAEWNFDEGAGQYAQDITGANNTGTLGTGSIADSADPIWAAGKIGKGLKFDGVNDYINCGSGATITSLTAYTIEAWINTTDTSTFRPLVVLSAGASFPGFFSHFSEGRLLLYLGGSNYRYFAASPTNIFDGNWHHVSIVVTGNAQSDINNSKLYVDGREQTALYTASSGPVSSPTACRIGANGHGYVYKGLTDHVRIYNYARTPAQIAWDYNRGEPVGWWKFDEESGTTAYDSSGNANHGTVTGATISREGKLHNALSLDGSGDYVSISDNSQLDSLTNNISMSVWVKTNGTADNDGLIYKGSLSNSQGIWNLHLVNNKPTVRLNNNGGSLESTTTLPPNTWSHLVVTYDQTNIKLYINGKLDKSSSYTVALSSDDNSVYLGCYYSSSYCLAGLLDDVRIYNYPLTAVQVKQLYGSGAVRFGN